MQSSHVGLHKSLGAMVLNSTPSTATPNTSQSIGRRGSDSRKSSPVAGEDPGYLSPQCAEAHPMVDPFFPFQNGLVGIVVVS